MAFLLGGANSATGGYNIDNSLRFYSAAEEKLEDTGLGTATSTKIGTLSVWCKLSGYTIGGASTNHGSILSSRVDDNNYLYLKHQDYGDTGKLYMKGYLSGSQNVLLETTRVLRDPSAWYHIVVAWDTTDSTEANRMKIYVNNEQITSWTQDTFPAEDALIRFNSSDRYIGVRRDNGTGNYYSGYMADYNIVDGLQLTPSNFAEADEDSGIWKPKEPDVSEYGTNGIFLEFKESGTSQNASGMGADTSGKGNHLAVTNLDATSVVTDSPTNNFCTMIPASNIKLSEGNLKGVTTRTMYWDAVRGSIGVTSGKWYFEMKASLSDDTFRVIGGFVGDPENLGVAFDGKGLSGDPLDHINQTSTPFYGKGVWLSHWYAQDGNDASTASTQSSGDILQFALDLDNYKLYIGVGGTFYDNDNSADGDPAAGSNPSVTIPSAAYTGRTFFPAFWLRDDDDADDNVAEMNFGNPPFAISSGNADANGYGNFEYAVPSGYYALCTKNLAEFG